VHLQIFVNMIGNVAQANEGESHILETLEWLWDTIVEPILTRLGFLDTPPDTDHLTWPRIWWCPTGLLSYLPLHAAGHHRDLQQMPGRCVIDRVVSSYIPTARTMKHVRKNWNVRSASEIQRALIIAVESTPGYARLPLARDEAYCIERAIIDQDVFEDVEVEESPTLEYISRQLPGTRIAHFACHALSTVEPSDGGILLGNEKLNIGAISQMRLQSGALAYLSACNTALSKAVSLRDECITLSSAFQVAGFARVVGTLWKSEDHTSYNVAATFYSVLQSDVTRSAIALHEAVVEQRASHFLEPSLWAGYIYTGC
jgi:CHAT domain-containing protein